jgi:hypothetical protein
MPQPDRRLSEFEPESPVATVRFAAVQSGLQASKIGKIARYARWRPAVLGRPTRQIESLHAPQWRMTSSAEAKSLEEGISPVHPVNGSSDTDP